MQPDLEREEFGRPGWEATERPVISGLATRGRPHPQNCSTPEPGQVWVGSHLPACFPICRNHSPSTTGKVAGLEAHRGALEAGPSQSCHTNGWSIEGKWLLALGAPQRPSRNLCSHSCSPLADPQVPSCRGQRGPGALGRAGTGHTVGAFYLWGVQTQTPACSGVWAGVSGPCSGSVGSHLPLMLTQYKLLGSASGFCLCCDLKILA